MDSYNKNEAGSKQKVEPAFVLIGHLQKAHGIHGEIAMRFLSDFPQRIRKGRKVYLGEDYLQFTITDARWNNKLMLLSFAGIENREEVSKLTNFNVYAAVKDLPVLPDGKLYQHQLLGLQVWEKSEFLGEISEILVTGANDVYVIKQPDNKELLIPAIDSVIINIDLDRNRMEISLLEGLRD